MNNSELVIVEEPTMRKLADKIRVLENKNRKFNDLLEKIKEDFREVERLRDDRYAELKSQVLEVIKWRSEFTLGYATGEFHACLEFDKAITQMSRALDEVNRLEPTS